MTWLLEAQGLRVAFGGVQALDGLDLSVTDAEIHGIIGPNGAGKTTAMNVLTGFIRPGSGTVRFAGAPLPAQPHLIARAGIGRTFQSSAIFADLSAVENVMCGGHRWSHAGLFRCMVRSRGAQAEEAELRRTATDWLGRVGFQFPVDAPVSALPFGEHRKMEVARALMGRPRLLLLDEPTAGLTEAEVHLVGGLLRTLRRDSAHPLSIVLVEHNVPFIFSLCDRVTAVDKGRTILSGSPADIRRNGAVIQSYLGGGGAMGHAPEPAAAVAVAASVATGAPVLELRGMRAGYGRIEVIRGIDMTIHSGELAVVCGRNGAGKSTLLNAIAGQPKVSGGEVLWCGARIDGLSVSRIARRGLALVPQERGIIAGQTVESNLRLSTGGLGLNRAGYRARRDALFTRFPKLGARRNQVAGTLSGGERQMLALAKALLRQPKLLLLDEPSIGLAPTILEELQRMVDDIRADGIAVVVAEQNVWWVAPLAQRAFLIDSGRIVASGPPDEIIPRERLLESFLGDDGGEPPAEAALSLVHGGPA
jgi:ABC-type branched-subunit amino acid transport system ATPase component